MAAQPAGDLANQRSEPSGRLWQGHGGAEIDLAAIQPEGIAASALDLRLAGQEVAQALALSICQPLRQVGGGLEVADPRQVLQHGILCGCQLGLHRAEIGHIRVGVDERGQPQAVERRADGVFRAGNGRVVEQHGIALVFPFRGHVRADAQGIAQAKRWQDRRAAGQEVSVVAHGFAQNAQSVPVGGFARHVVRDVCRAARLRRENRV